MHAHACIYTHTIKHLHKCIYTIKHIHAIYSQTKVPPTQSLVGHSMSFCLLETKYETYNVTHMRIQLNLLLNLKTTAYEHRGKHACV